MEFKNLYTNLHGKKFIMDEHLICKKILIVPTEKFLYIADEWKIQNADNNSSSHSERKLDSHWLMPFSMVLKLGACTYRLQSCKDMLYRTIVHFGRLKPYVEEASKGEAKAPGNGYLPGGSKGSLGILPNHATPASLLLPHALFHGSKLSKVSILSQHMVDNMFKRVPGKNKFCRFVEHISAVVKSSNKFCSDMEIPCLVKLRQLFSSSVSPFHSDEYLFE
ncbi:hypothetical protein T07_5343 [Trichinella nelsoni]|uniref:Uncharacterized protein n=1 Tax=Trichinella nelsoni TaxID=6336 RepID=A0A0V0SJW5_9BILA|nr:hypothetical protein T07_5343 [Trichinella nelsoni]